jgi:CDP-diacylglycerol---glycerol-3-phosphate 3-phosphatidyltransferase
MTLANVLTILRIILSPVFFIIFSLVSLLPGMELFLIIMLWIVFIIIELSDFFDGIAARSLGEVSDLGKVLDPFADSVSRLTYFICFAMAGILPFWIFIILVYRDLFTSFLRMYFSTKGMVYGSRFTGKIKAWVYAIAGIIGLIYFSLKKLLILNEVHATVLIVTNIIFLLCVVIALITVADYSSVFLKKKNQKNY